ncbi:hypothetical protein BDR22DRAFT_844136 [Usnea florida]
MALGDRVPACWRNSMVRGWPFVRAMYVQLTIRERSLPPISLERDFVVMFAAKIFWRALAKENGCGWAVS